MTFSLCMIVKNEEKTLGRCLDSLKNVMDEIIIVDTGSTDSTKEIAKKYTDKIFDFNWIDDFSAARNYAFSKATCDYIYSADADEFLDEENQKQLEILKQVILPEVEIVQMIYITKFENHATENFERDYRPKLYKRVRRFNWIDPIHEIVNLNPVVFDSDIEIIHMPERDHSDRDFRVFEKTIEREGVLPERILAMYLRELYKAGTKEDIEKSYLYLAETLQQWAGYNKELICRQLIAVLIKYYRQVDKQIEIIKLALESEANDPSAEICFELGMNFLDNDDPNEAAKWFYQAAYNAECELDINCQAEALNMLSVSYLRLANSPKLMNSEPDNFMEIKMELENKAEEFKKEYELKRK